MNSGEGLKVLVTGAAGFVGSHTVFQLLEEGHSVVAIDNYANSSEESLKRVRELSGKDFFWYECDISNATKLREILDKHPEINCVIHFAGLKAVGESVQIPLKYYKVNVSGTLVMLEVLNERGIKKLVFSSSATVYGDPHKVPIDETFPLNAINPYGRTKLFLEEIFRDLCTADPDWSVVLLRYFNPVGAHPSGRIGESPLGIPNNLMPIVSQVAVGKRPEVKVFGNDYPTPDGTGVRDYIHVLDLAAGHTSALKKVFTKGCHVYNLGTGRGYSVLEMIQAMKKASGREIKYTIADRRPGDCAVVLADPSKAQNELGWNATRTLVDMCNDMWRWQSSNPNGYENL